LLGWFLGWDNCLLDGGGLGLNLLGGFFLNNWSVFLFLRLWFRDNLGGLFGLNLLFFGGLGSNDG
jgi:hypothetical protein